MRLLFPIQPDRHELPPSKPGRVEPLSAGNPAPEELLLPSHDEAKTLCNLAAQIRVPGAIAKSLGQHKLLPKHIIVRSPLLLDLLEPLEKELEIQLRRAHELPAIDEAAASMAQWLETGKM